MTGTVTVTLKEVPWDQALDIVLRNQTSLESLKEETCSGLRRERHCRPKTRNAGWRATLLWRQFRQSASTYVLNYPKAADVASTLLASRVVSQRGRVATEPRRNAIIVTDVAGPVRCHREDEGFIDTPAQQVEIEARLLSANKSFSREFGRQLGLLVGANTGNMLTGGTGEPSPFEQDSVSARHVPVDSACRF